MILSPSMKCLSFQKVVNIKLKSQRFDYITSKMYLNHLILLDCYAFQETSI